MKTAVLRVLGKGKWAGVAGHTPGGCSLSPGAISCPGIKLEAPRSCGVSPGRQLLPRGGPAAAQGFNLGFPGRVLPSCCRPQCQAGLAPCLVGGVRRLLP